MSTAVTGAPARRSASSARMELPHMAICGVPFMNRATGSPSITCLIFALRSFMRVPFVLIRNSWMVPSASGAASASFTSRCWSISDEPCEPRRRDGHLEVVAAAGAVLDGELGRVGERLRQARPQLSVAMP